MFDIADRQAHLKRPPSRPSNAAEAVRRAPAALVGVGAILAFAPPPAEAVLSGTNGRIAFTSGRASGDALAEL